MAGGLTAPRGAAMECPHCQHEMISGANVCHHCGKGLPSALLDRLLRLGMVVILVCALALAGLLILRALASVGL